ncbi:alkanesulfonate monooxygenase SsuD/methylene tetrahydromethanopterin reductase-like flavin-dependent oxidoreductase (luciferase family) [Rhodoligotrophos appendicifer]|uniref:LLM class flavin-dependent oxidoreductase n=1 Tax=Rhodoligotrophos appendicifer TaxID=987056 RepID=UPI00117C8AD6|nr:LLM class flavin-dependent oxidoreductase [Rhodoligotrophos appendicifer]
MRFGLFNLMNQWNLDQRDVYRGALDCTRLAEEIGFDIAWFAEHHFSNYSLCPSPLMMAAAAARETNKIRLGPAVIVAPLYNPIRLAEEVALLDQLSEGRAVLGLGSGYQRFEFDAFGADLSERQERMLEIWRIVDQAVHENRFEFSGKFYTLPAVPQAISLYKPRRLDTFFVSWSPEIIDHAVATGAVPFITVGWGDTAALTKMHDFVGEKYAEAGHSLAGRPFAAQRYVYVSEDRSELERVAAGIRYAGRCAGHMRVGAQTLNGHVIEDLPVEGEPSLATIQASVPIGAPEVVAERLVNEIRTNGITDLSCFMWPAGIEAKAALRSMERFGRDVVPLVEKALREETAAPVQQVA